MRPCAIPTLAKTLLILASVIAFLSGCNWVNLRESAHNHILDRQSIVLDRANDPTLARLAFKTEIPAFCEIKLWGHNVYKRTLDQPFKVQPCSNKQPQTDFVELIEGLNENSFHTIELNAWSNDLGSQVVDRVEINESERFGVGKEFYVVRLNKPFHVAEVHRYTNPVPIASKNLNDLLQLETGCKAGFPQITSQFSNSGKFELEEVESKGYARGKLNPHAHSDEFKRLNIGGYHPNLTWDFDINSGSDQFTFSANQAGEFKEVLVTIQNQSTPFQSPSLLHPSPSLYIEQDQSFELKWKSRSIFDIGYVIVQFGHAGQDAGFYCVFDAAKDSAIIHSEPFLTSLDIHQAYDVTVTLYTAQVRRFPSSGWSPWLLTSYDWRTAVLERKT